MAQKIRLTESGLHRIVKESVNKILKEDLNTPERNLYRQIVSVLTDYEDGNANGEDLYTTLVNVQNWMCDKGYDTWS